jgi:hypothetical protein
MSQVQIVFILVTMTMTTSRKHLKILKSQYGDLERSRNFKLENFDLPKLH